MPWKHAKDEIWLIGETFQETDCPKLNWELELNLYEFLQKNIEAGLLKSSLALGKGDLLFALHQISKESNLGAIINLIKPPDLTSKSLLFGESASKF